MLMAGDQVTEVSASDEKPVSHDDVDLGGSRGGPTLPGTDWRQTSKQHLTG